MKLKKPVAILCALMMLFCSVILPGASVSAATKETPKRTIAIVYDNSGSMFGDGNASWCQAQYAIEVFADMMNDGDKLMVYPMHTVTLDGDSTTYSYHSIEGVPLVITSDNQKEKIRTMQTDFVRNKDGNYDGPNTGTPIESIDAAYEGLMKESGEKWLIVLTDGDQFHKWYEAGETNPNTEKTLSETTNVTLSAENTKTELGKTFSRCVNDVNILYLGIGKISPPVVSGTSNTYYAETANSDKVPETLTTMCNMIFGRDALPEKFHTEKSVEFDVPLSRLFLFIQGENISNVKLSQGGSQFSAVKTFSPHYGDKGCINKNYGDKFATDSSLQGAIAVYTDLPSGTYDIGYSGNAKSVAYYYEPDADLAVVLVDANGNVINSADEVQPGEYTIKCALVDKDGHELRSELLGDIEYELSYTIDGQQVTENGKQSYEKKFTFNSDTEFSVNSVDVEFLSGYRLRKSGAQLGFLSIPFGASKAAAGSLVIEVSGGFESVDSDMLDSTEPIVVKLTYDGQAVSDGMLDDIDFTVSPTSDRIKYDLTKCPSGYGIKLSSADGEPIPAGSYGVKFEAKYSSETVEESKASAAFPFEVNEVTDVLALEFIKPETYFTVYGLDKAEPIEVGVTLNGEPLTAEQFSKVSFTADGGDVMLGVQSNPDSSSYILTIDPASEIEPDRYTIKVNASGLKGRSGDELTAENELAINFGLIPKWLKTLIILGAILLLILIIVFILTRPVLPRKMKFLQAKVFLDGEEQKPVSANITYPKSGHKRTIKFFGGNGTLKNVKWTATLVPAKNSYRYLPSKKRKAMVVNGSVKASQNVSSIMIGSEKFVRDEETGKLVRRSKNTTDFPFTKGTVKYSGNKDIDGISTDFSVNGNISFTK